MQKQKKAETAIVWPEELRRARNESSRKAAQVRRMNREHLKATGERPRPKKKKEPIKKTIDQPYLNPVMAPITNVGVPWKTAMEKKARIDHNMDVQLNVMYDEEKWVLRLQIRLVNFPLN